MNALFNSIVAIGFLGIAIALTFLMFYLWKFPYDKENHKTQAPWSLVTTHRLLGYVYVVLYIYLMWQMVPRLWAYQIELPARTVIHLTLGMSIGAILIIKIAIVKYFKQLEAKLVPFLGVGLLIATMLLVSLALPFSLREAYLSATTISGEDGMTAERIDRVRKLLPKAGVEDKKTIDILSTQESLKKGRRVLMTKCTQCHDLRTVLARPRTPASWQQTVSRMANRSTVLNPITDQDQLEVMAYLIAISPTLQQTLADKRKTAMESAKSQAMSIKMAKKLMAIDGEDLAIDPQKSKEVFEQRCSQCHGYTHIEKSPPGNKEDAIMLVQRMIGNGLILTEQELIQVISHISNTYLKEELPEANEQTKIENDTGYTPISALDGVQLFDQHACSSCHGPEGREPIAGNYPRLASQNKEYIKMQISDILNGVRNNGLAVVMRVAVSNISDQEIDAIAEYLSKLDR